MINGASDIKDMQPSEKAYKNLVKLGQFIINHLWKDSFESYGTENLEEDYYQMFLSNHKFYTDPIIIQLAIILASGNDNPIPTPSYKLYMEHKALGPLLATLFSYPIYDKGDGYIKKEESLQYSVDCFLKHERMLIFPEGRISHDGKLAIGRIGSAEIAWRTYHHIKKNNSLEGKKKGLKIIPVDVSYSPIAGIPYKDVDKTTVRFGKPIDFEKKVIETYNSAKNKFKDKKKLKKKLQIKLMNKIMKKIGSLTTVNMDQIASRIIYDFAKENYPLIEKEYFEELVQNTVENLNKSGRLHLLDDLKTKEGAKKAYINFLRRCAKRQIIGLHKSTLHLNLDYILSEPKFEDVRNENMILYNYNLLDHCNSLLKG